MAPIANSLYAAGISHETAGPEILGKFGMPQAACSFAENGIMQIGGVSEALVLSTCNRVEVYFPPLPTDSRTRCSTPLYGADAEDFKKICSVEKTRRR